MSSAKWKDTEDVSATFKVQWDARYIYIAVEVTDDVVTEPHGALTKVQRRVPGTTTGWN